MYRDNAMYSEQSQQQATHAKVDALGGIDKAVAFDTTASQLKAMKDKGATTGEISKQIQNANPGMGKDAADKLAQGIIEGSKQGANEFAKALQGAAGLANTQSQTKTGSDLKSIGQFKSPEDYIKANQDVAVEKAGQTKAHSKALRLKGQSGSILDSDGNLTDEGVTAMERRENYNIGEQMKRSSNFSDKKLMSGRLEKMLNAPMSLDGRKEVAEGMVDVGMLKSLPKFNKDGKVDKSSIDMGENSGAAMSRAFGEAEGNRMTDKMGGIVLGGYEFKVNGDSITAKKDNSVAENSQKSFREGKNIDTGGDVRSAVQAWKAVPGNKGEPSMGELVDFIGNSQMAESSKNHLFGHLAAGIADSTGFDQNVVEAAMFGGGSALAAIGLNNMLGKPINKTLGMFKDTLSGQKPKANKQAPNTPNYGSSNNGDNKQNSSTENKTTHVDTPSENLSYSKEQINSSRESISNDSKELKKEQAKKIPNQSRIAELEENIEKETNNLEANKKYYDENLKKDRMPKTNKIGNTAAKVGKDFIKGAGVGFAIDTAADEATQYFADNGDFKTGNATAAIGDVTSGVWGTVAGSAITAVGYLSNSPTIKNYGKNMVDDAGQSIADAVVHTEAAINGDHNVFRHKKGTNTTFGDLLGYGSVSQHIPPGVQQAFTQETGANTKQAMQQDGVLPASTATHVASQASAPAEQVTNNEQPIERNHTEGKKVINTKGEDSTVNISGGSSVSEISSSPKIDNSSKESEPSFMRPNPNFSTMQEEKAKIQLNEQAQNSGVVSK